MGYSFFIDTADVEYIKQKWEVIKPYVKPYDFVGITTNPAAFHKENLFSLKEWKARTKELLELLSEMQTESREELLLYIQVPSDDLEPRKVVKWYDKIATWNTLSDRPTISVGMKIPPYKKYLDVVQKNLGYQFEPVNVTGVSDCATALACMQYGVVRYVSMIPGRMEEKGMDAKSQVAYVMTHKPNECDLITGAMRTLEGLKWCVEYGTVPTIGKRVLDLVTKDNAKEVFQDWKHEPAKVPVVNFAPEIDSRSRELSEAFFQQMNEMSKQVKEEFLLGPKKLKK